MGSPECFDGNNLTRLVAKYAKLESYREIEIVASSIGDLTEILKVDLRREDAIRSVGVEEPAFPEDEQTGRSFRV